MGRKIFNLLSIMTLIISAVLPGFLITVPVSAAEDFDLPEKVTFDAIIRDFTPQTNPDFENRTFYNNALRIGSKAVKGLVQDELDEDGKPVYKGPGYYRDDYGVIRTNVQMITSDETFSQWYRDIEGVNKPIKRKIDLTLNYEKGEPYYGFWDAAFFPIDDNLLLDDEETFGNYPGTEVEIEVRSGSGTTEKVRGTRNFHFTTEIESKFMYKGGERFTFIGDDDVWVFIDGKLVIDLGGVHGSVNETIYLDDLDIGLEKGKIYSFHFFHAERHTVESNFQIQTTIDFYTEQDHKMNLMARNEGGSYGSEASGMVGDIVELRYVFPEQEIELPELENMEITKIKFNFETNLPRGLVVIDSGGLIESNIVDERGYLIGTKLRRPDSGNDFDLDYEFDEETGKYRVKEHEIIIKVKLMRPGAYRINPEDTIANYSLYYTDGAIVGLHRGHYSTDNNVDINVRFRARIEGPDSVYLGEIVTYTVITDLEDTTDASFTWTVDESCLKIVEDNGEIVKVKAVGMGESEIGVNVEYNGVEQDAEKTVNIMWAIDIQ